MKTTVEQRDALQQLLETLHCEYDGLINDHRIALLNKRDQDEIDLIEDAMANLQNEIDTANEQLRQLRPFPDRILPHEGTQ